MKRIFTLLVAALALASCTQDVAENIEINAEKPTYYASFADAEAESRTYLDENLKLLWHNDDRISLFATTYNEEYAFVDATGSNSGAFNAVDNDSWVTGNPISTPYAVYPYNAANAISNSEVLTIYFPAEQTYMENSFGRGANTMVAAAESAESKLLPFRNAGGYLMLKLYGESKTVKSIELKGNNEEVLSGAATAEAKYGYLPAITMGTEGGQTITLNCEEAVTLGATEAEATVFWLVVPPITFEKGFTITVTDAEGGTFVQSTSKEVIIERNEIKSMAPLTPNFEGTTEDPEEPKPANNEIWYTNGSTTEATAPNATDVFGANIVSNTYDAEKECWVITFDGDVTSIGSSAFYFNSNITSIAMPDSVTKIGDAAFYLCSSLTSAYIPEGVTAFGDQAFYYCAQLESITIPESVETIGYDTFNNCKALSEFNGKFASADGRCLIIDGALHSFAPAGITEYAIPEGITAIRQHAFYECTRLTSVTIPEGVTSIGEMVFYGCSSLTGTLTIPDSVTEIGTRAFFGCKGLTEFKSKFASADGRCLVIDGSLHSFAPAGITEYAIPEGVTTIAPYTFYNCSNLTNITIPNGTTTLGDRSFYNCSSLTSITLVESITQIGDYVFNGCSSLASVYCKATNPPTAVFRFGWSAFEKNASDRKIYVPTTAVEDYKAANGWSKYADYIEGYDF